MLEGWLGTRGTHCGAMANTLLFMRCPRSRSVVSTMDWGLDSEEQVELGWVKTGQVDARSYLENRTWCFVGIWAW